MDRPSDKSNVIRHPMLVEILDDLKDYKPDLVALGIHPRSERNRSEFEGYPKLVASSPERGIRCPNSARAEERERVARGADYWVEFCEEDNDEHTASAFRHFAAAIRLMKDEKE